MLETHNPPVETGSSIHTLVDIFSSLHTHTVQVNYYSDHSDYTRILLGGMSGSTRQWWTRGWEKLEYLVMLHPLHKVCWFLKTSKENVMLNEKGDKVIACLGYQKNLSQLWIGHYTK